MECAPNHGLLLALHVAGAAASGLVLVKVAKTHTAQDFTKVGWLSVGTAALAVGCFAHTVGIGFSGSHVVNGWDLCTWGRKTNTD